MQQLTINIPEAKVPFFMELVQNLGFIEVDETPSQIPQWQIDLVDIERKRIKEDPSYLLDWEDARKMLHLD